MQSKFLMWAITLYALMTAISSDAFTINHALVSIYVVRMDTGEVIMDQNSELSLIPASCMKIATTGAALHLLGVEGRFETKLEYDGFIDSQKTLHGNIYIRGGGDPCLGSDRIAGNLSWEKQIEVWADAVQKLGLQRIEGRVIGDATKWEKALAAPSWSWEDLGNYYGAGASALSFHENAYSLFFRPGEKVGDDAPILYTDPPTSLLAFQNEVKTGPEGSGDQAWIFASEFSSIQFVRGTIPAAVHEFVIKGAILNPALTCSDLLMQGLRKRKISVGGGSLKERKEKTLFHTTSSPTIKEIVYWTNQKSINLYAEHLLKALGEKLYGEGSTASGARAVSAFWKSQQLDLEGFNIADGSGLSRKNLVTAKQFVGMLLKMKESEYFPYFFESLPQKNSAIRAKSGSMSLIKGYVGYMGNLAFAVLVNQCLDAKLMNEKIESLLAELETLGH